MKNIIKIFSLLIFIFTVYGCNQTTSSTSTLNLTNRIQNNSVASISSSVLSQTLDINIIEFNPGISGNPADYEKNGIWPELRRAESRKFAVDLKTSLKKSKSFTGIYITPDERYLSDVSISGKIIKSNGRDLHLEISANDSTGTTLINKKLYEGKVDKGYYKNLRNKGKNPFETLVFDKIATDIITALQKRDLDNIKLITELRFAREMNPSSYNNAVREENRIVYANFIPASSDPMFLRSKNVRSKDLYFRENMQSTYNDFVKNMDESYEIWKQASYDATIKAEEAKRSATWKGVLGAAILIGGAIALGDSMDGMYVDGGQYVAGLGGAMLGAGLLDSALMDNDEAKVHKETIMEVSQSFDSDIAPSVIEMEEKTVELDGTLTQQFIQWQDILKEIYNEQNSNIEDIQIL